MSTHRSDHLDADQTLRRFTKGHGTRNDFVIIPDPDGLLDLTAEDVARLADRRAGIGGDGVIRVVRSAAAGIDAPGGAPEWCMDYRNADGSIAEMCGNGVRVFAAYLDRAGLLESDDLAILTRAGQRRVEILERPAADGEAWQVRVGMGAGTWEETGRIVRIAGRELPVLDVDMGNPHAVALLPEDLALEDLDLTTAPVLDPAPVSGANIELVSLRGERHAAMRVFERGVGETESCGTGAAAVGVAAALWAQDESGQPWRVDVPGGTLTIGWREDEVTLAGPAVLVADGDMHL